MPTKHCFWVSCNSDSRYKHKEHMQGVFFVPIPAKLRDPEKYNRWIHLCGRSDFTIKSTHCSSSATWTQYICSKHFVGGNGPTETYPDPFPAHYTKQQAEAAAGKPTRSRKRRWTQGTEDRSDASQVEDRSDEFKVELDDGSYEDRSNAFQVYPEDRSDEERSDEFKVKLEDRSDEDRRDAFQVYPEDRSDEDSSDEDRSDAFKVEDRSDTSVLELATPVIKRENEFGSDCGTAGDMHVSGTVTVDTGVQTDLYVVNVNLQLNLKLRAELMSAQLEIERLKTKVAVLQALLSQTPCNQKDRTVRAHTHTK